MPFTLTQGIHANIDEADYHGLEYFSNSKLKKFLRSPAHFKWAADHPDQFKTTDAMRLGTATEMAVMEPARFGETYAVSDGCTASLASGKRKGEQCGLSATFRSGDDFFCGKHAPNDAEKSENVLTRSEAARARGMATSVHGNKLAAELLFKTRGLNQVTICWQDRITGVACKGRIDRLCEWHGRRVVVDLKTTNDAMPWEFSRKIHSFGYHTQHGMYNDGLATLDEAAGRDPIPAVPILIVIESEAPYPCAVYQLEDAAINQGRMDYLNAMNRYKYCREQNFWPAYTDEINATGEPDFIGLPKYAYTGDF